MSDATEIKTVVGALAAHVDTREWDALLELFAPQVRLDYTSLFGGNASDTSREQLIAQWRSMLPGFSNTTHLIGAPLVTVNGETATVRASVVAWHILRMPETPDEDHWVVGGCYEMDMRRIDGAWRISSLTLARAWQQGNPELPEVATKLVAATSRTH